MSRLQKELAAYKERERIIRVKEKELQELQQRHALITQDIFGIAPHRVATVEGMITAIDKIVTMRDEK